MRLACLPIFLLTLACGDAPSASRAAERGGPPLVYALSEPLRCFAERIGGARIELCYPIPAGIDPAFWEPSDEDIAALQEADAILLNGATYERWLQHASLPPSRCVDTSAGFADRWIEVEGELTHSHGPEGEHSHGGTAFTTWLDLTLASRQAEAVRDGLVALVPAERAAFDAAHAALADELNQLDERMLAAAPREPVIASHPVYQYWARRCAVDLRSVHFEPDAEPDESGWAELEALLRERPAKVMIWEAEPTPKTRERIEALGLRIVVLAPSGNRLPEGDFLAVMRANVARLEE